MGGFGAVGVSVKRLGLRLVSGLWAEDVNAAALVWG